jgi:hypothetical protein
LQQPQRQRPEKHIWRQEPELSGRFTHCGLCSIWLSTLPSRDGPSLRGAECFANPLSHPCVLRGIRPKLNLSGEIRRDYVAMTNPHAPGASAVFVGAGKFAWVR